MGTGRGGVYGYNDGTVLYSVKENTTGDILEDGEEAFNEGKSAEIGAFTGGNADKKLRKSKILLMRYRILLKRWT